jgi:hypothetical protein
MPAKRPAKKVSAKKAPAKKAAPRKKSTSKKRTKTAGNQFVLRLRQGVSIDFRRNGSVQTGRPDGTNLESGDVLLLPGGPPDTLNPGPSSGYDQVGVEERSSGTIGLGFNLPPSGKPPKLNLNLSIFQTLTRDPSSSTTWANQLDAQGRIIFTIGIEG